MPTFNGSRLVASPSSPKLLSFRNPNNPSYTQGGSAASMKETSGLLRSFSALKSFSDKVGDAFAKLSSSIKHRKDHQNLKRRLLEAMKQRGYSNQNTFRSINSIIMWFPHFKEGLQNIKNIFEKYVSQFDADLVRAVIKRTKCVLAHIPDEDSNGTMDHEELKKCLRMLQIQLSEKDIDRLYHYCDMDENKGIQYHEFIVLLCFAYLLAGPDSATNNMSNSASRHVEATFDKLAEAFAFLDKNGDGKLDKKDIILALNEAPSKEKSPTHITSRRFKEMDRNKDGTVSFKEFLFSLIKWIGIDTDHEKEPLRTIEVW
ncbi:probable calcium-binding protein CML22 isoform X1 [Musa acuminata AAA Group]|uniref:probable calcium-binding protein CML22 isoform X1 n=1 Tax=Musa acuminata AAA Group TaxID=214697 RepID=UPI0031CF1A6E